MRKTLERWKLLEPGSAQEDVFEKLGVTGQQGGDRRADSPRWRSPSISKAEPADLLVVSTAGREGAARWLHGSVAEAMLRWSRTMTLFVPADADRDLVALADGNLTLRNVLIPVDRAPDPALQSSSRAAQPNCLSEDKVTITLLHVGAENDAPAPRTPEGPQWAFTHMHRDGEVVDEIATTAEVVRADLIVMPTEGRNGVFDALRGSTTERVLRRVRCPLLAVPAPRT